MSFNPFSILTDVRVHRVAAAVAAVLVVVQAQLSSGGLGLDPTTSATVVGAVAFVVTVLREFNNPSLLPTLVGFLKALPGKAPADPSKVVTPPTEPPATPPTA